ncbi:hypothetical protein LIER_02682 [Lithospermum erythrorhizon]|uniref:Uncharacterized protein n=1 Tax=Lithospermum erythrorhizon TaxID=34254 RepID=A0AAV3NRF9_LITER
MLVHEHFSCDEKFDDEARKVSRVNKYDGWLLVHGERRLHAGKKDFGREFFNARDAREGGRADVVGNRWRYQDCARYETPSTPRLARERGVHYLEGGRGNNGVEDDHRREGSGSEVITFCMAWWHVKNGLRKV